MTTQKSPIGALLLNNGALIKILAVTYSPTGNPAVSQFIRIEELDGLQATLRVRGMDAPNHRRTIRQDSRIGQTHGCPKGEGQEP